jgi:cathepsin C
MSYECFDENTCSNKCVAEKSRKSKLKFKIDDYYYVGNYYGYTTEDAIYEELLKYGPMVISLAPNYFFGSYRSGIFDADEITWKQLNMQQPEWQKVDHSVVLVGYGIENGIEYWLVQNSWGKNWGENGFMRLVKGKNLINIESLAESAQVSVVEEE